MAKRVPEKQDRLSSILPVRFFPHTRKEMKHWTKKHKGRWENEGHFVRAAVLHFCRELEREDLLREVVKNRLRKVRH
jgi:hypothetical protein